jgi:threonylcarbamoyladenosine tRNA methylthiotransferase MtaB
VRQLLRSVKRRHPGIKLVLAGCEARLRNQRRQNSSEVDWVLPYLDKTEDIAEMLQVLFPEFAFNAQNEGLINRASSKTRAFLKVQDGCNQFCSYCIVAHLRGKEWSRPVDAAVKEARQLVAQGHKELVLTGIHLGHFRPSLLALLQELEKIDGLLRRRLSSIESVEVDDALIDWVSTSPKACHHFHLPLQSGCDKILKAMQRPYNTADFRQVVERIRTRMPLAAITTDLMVGFPGETEEDFLQTTEFLQQINFSRIHIFRFSPRDGTPAATMAGQIGNQVKIERSHRVENIWKQSAADFHQKFVGKKVEILWETCEHNQMYGLSREYVPCFSHQFDADALNQVKVAVALSSSVKSLEVA